MQYTIAFASPVFFGILWSICQRFGLDELKTRIETPHRRRYAVDEINLYVFMYAASAGVSAFIMLAFAPSVVAAFLSAAKPEVVQFGVFLPAFFLSFAAMMMTALLATRLFGGIVDKFIAALRDVVAERT